MFNFPPSPPGLKEIFNVLTCLVSLLPALISLTFGVLAINFAMDDRFFSLGFFVVDYPY